MITTARLCANFRNGLNDMFLKCFTSLFELLVQDSLAVCAQAQHLYVNKNDI